MNKKRHSIDFLFPLALLFVFAVSAIVVLLFAADIYEETVSESSRNNSARTSIAYVTEKIHNSEAGSVSIGKLDDCDAIIIEQTVDDEDYLTYIYAYNDSLRELLVKSDFTASRELGSRILDVSEFNIEKINDKLIKIVCSDSSGKQAQTLVSIK